MVEGNHIFIPMIPTLHEKFNSYWLCNDCLYKTFNFIQPERSKREDLNCDNCKKRPVFNCCFGRFLHAQDDSCDEYQFRMRCSEHCRNAVRDK